VGSDEEGDNMSATWFTADHHFNHTGILTHTERPWADLHEMNAALIQAWNDVVGVKDTVWVLGDFGMCPRDGWDIEDIFAGLHGTKHLVRGNHDQDKRNRRVLELPWASVQDIAMVRAEGHRFHVCHYPLSEWAGFFRGVLHLHGHTHGTLTEHLPRRRDVGVDLFSNYAPISAQTVIEMVSQDAPLEADHRPRPEL
jgi:calcineurin-like phosphoesterase family protein